MLIVQPSDYFPETVKRVLTVHSLQAIKKHTSLCLPTIKLVSRQARVALVQPDTSHVQLQN